MSTKTISKPIHTTGRDKISKFINAESNKELKARLSEREIKTRNIKQLTSFAQIMETENKRIEKRSFWVILSNDEKKCLHFSKTIKNEGTITSKKAKETAQV
jgi:hypothetical protein